VREIFPAQSRKTSSRSAGKNGIAECYPIQEFDADLLNEFIVENMELAIMAESAILDWEKNPGNPRTTEHHLPGFSHHQRNIRLPQS